MLKKRGLTTYALINKHGYSSHTIHRLRHNCGISTALINELCELLKCRFAWQYGSRSIMVTVWTISLDLRPKKPVSALKSEDTVF